MSEVSTSRVTTGLSLTKDLRAYLASAAMVENCGGDRISPTNDSIYTLSTQENLTLREYVRKNPNKALKEAEYIMAQWSSVLTEAGMTGGISVNDTFVPLSKNTVKMVEERVKAAKEDLNTVRMLSVMPDDTAGLRKDVIIDALYKKAVYQNDTKALIYLFDRIEGRPGETKVNDTDWDNRDNVRNILYYGLFDKQLEVLQSGPGTKIIMAGRRSGKTHLGCAAMLLSTLSRKNTTAMFIGQTKTAAESLVTTGMNDLIDKCDLRDNKGRRLNWKKLDNGSTITVRGLSSIDDLDQVRGPRAEIIVIDEFFHMKTNLLEYFMREVLTPMQLDYAKSYQMLLIGSCPSIRHQYGEKVWDEWDIPHYEWTCFENPYPDGLDKEVKLKYIQEAADREHVSMDSAYIQREFYNRRVYDTDLLLFPDFTSYDPELSVPQIHVDRVFCGIDYGTGDNTAIVGVAWDDTEKRGYVFFERKFNRLTIDQSRGVFQTLKDEVSLLWSIATDFFPSMNPAEANKRVSWVFDTDQTMVTQEFAISLRHPADATLRMKIMPVKKHGNVTLMQDKIRELLRSGNLVILKDGLCQHEFESTVVLRGPNGEAYPDVDDKTYHPDLIPALRYALWYAIGIGAPKR